MAPVHKVAVVQLHPKPLQSEVNFTRAASFIRSAAQQEATVVVLPEYCLTGWVPDQEGFLAQCDLWKVYLEKFQTLAKELSVCIVPGTIIERHRDEETNEKLLFNTAYFIDHNGHIIGKYVKKNLWGSIERDHLTSSGRTPHEVFDTPIGKVGLLICWDLAFPEAFRELIARGAQIIIVPTFWKHDDGGPKGMAYNPATESLFLDSVLTTRSYENTCAVVFANAGGPPGEQYVGLSQVCLPFVGAIAKLSSAAEGMAIVDIDMQILEDAEENYQVRADLARDDWHYDYRHQLADT